MKPAISCLFSLPATVYTTVSTSVRSHKQVGKQRREITLPGMNMR